MSACGSKIQDGWKIVGKLTPLTPQLLLFLVAKDRSQLAKINWMPVLNLRRNFHLNDYLSPSIISFRVELGRIAASASSSEGL